MKKVDDSEQPRFPDFGPCDIGNYKVFLEKSKKKFRNCFDQPFICNDKLSNFHQVSLLANGSFADVILVQHKVSGKYFAMKAVEKYLVIKNKQLEHIKNEKTILKCIDFPLTVYLRYCFKDNSYIYLILPFIPGGELFGHLRKFGSFDEQQAKFYVSQVVLAVEYLHNLDLIYRDLKPENILIDHTGYLKITDFGFCKRLVKSHTYTLCGTPEYLAPEVILSKGYGLSVDWWGVGVLTFELVAGQPPFYGTDPMKVYEKIVHLKYKIPSSFSSELKDLVKNILHKDLSKRYGNMKNGVDDIKNHRWFKTINWLSVVNRKMPAPYEPLYINPGDTRHFEKTKWVPLSVSNVNQYAEEFADF